MEFASAVRRVVGGGGGAGAGAPVGWCLMAILVMVMVSLLWLKSLHSPCLPQSWQRNSGGNDTLPTDCMWLYQWLSEMAWADIESFVQIRLWYQASANVLPFARFLSDPSVIVLLQNCLMSIIHLENLKFKPFSFSFSFSFSPPLSLSTLRFN